MRKNKKIKKLKKENKQLKKEILRLRKYAPDFSILEGTF